MDIKQLFSKVILVSGSLLLFVHFSATSTSKVIEEQQNENINLALRQVAHFMYIDICDSTTQIPPVVRISENSYSIKLDSRIAYNNLYAIVEKAIKDYDLPQRYSISLTDCHSDIIRLGFNSRAISSGEIPCQTREQTSDCNIIKLAFLTEEVQTSFPVYYGIGLLGLGFLLLILRRKKSHQGKEEEKEEVEAPQKLNSIKLGNSTFDLDNLKVTVNDVEKTITYRESKLLKLLISNPNEILKRDLIQSQVWEEEGVIVGRSLDVFISRLRKILKDDDTLKIKNIHGVGYKLVVD